MKHHASMTTSASGRSSSGWCLGLASSELALCRSSAEDMMK